MVNGLRILASVFTFVGMGATVVPFDEAPATTIAASSFDACAGATRVTLHSDSCVPADQCCKICSKGKACGNSCIRQSYTCHKGRGCACNADEVCE